MGIWQRITGAFRHADERRAAPSHAPDFELSRQPSYEELEKDLEKDNDRKEALTTGVGYGANNEQPPARREFEHELEGLAKKGVGEGGPLGSDR